MVQYEVPLVLALVLDGVSFEVEWSAQQPYFGEEIVLWFAELRSAKNVSSGSPESCFETAARLVRALLLIQWTRSTSAEGDGSSCPLCLSVLP